MTMRLRDNWPILLFLAASTGTHGAIYFAVTKVRVDPPIFLQTSTLHVSLLAPSEPSTHVRPVPLALQRPRITLRQSTPETTVTLKTIRASVPTTLVAPLDNIEAADTHADSSAEMMTLRQSSPGTTGTSETIRASAPTAPVSPLINVGTTDTNADSSVEITPPSFDVTHLKNPKPPYPLTSRRMGEQGQVRLHVLITPLGNVSEVRVQNSSGFPRLDQSALDTVLRKWRFSAPSREQWRTVAIVFNLEE